MAFQRHIRISAPPPWPNGNIVNSSPRSFPHRTANEALYLAAWRDQICRRQARLSDLPLLPPPAPDTSISVPALVAANDNLPAPAVPGRVTVRRVLAVTASHFGLTVEDLISHRRTQPLVRRRQIAMHVAHRLTGRGTPFIGRCMGGRDHSTILCGVRAIKARIDAVDVETIAAVKAIIARATGGSNG